MSISLLGDLQTGEYDTALFLTYQIDLRFFELMILPRLMRRGVSRIGILIDQRGYQESFSHPILPEECGKKYILAPIRLRGGEYNTPRSSGSKKGTLLQPILARII